ncbi:MAG: hypothetical protein ACI8WY_004214, partial [Planctomycetota bacterium]
SAIAVRASGEVEAALETEELVVEFMARRVKGSMGHRFTGSADIGDVP